MGAAMNKHYSLKKLIHRLTPGFTFCKFHIDMPILSWSTSQKYFTVEPYRQFLQKNLSNNLHWNTVKNFFSETFFSVRVLEYLWTTNVFNLISRLNVEIVVSNYISWDTDTQNTQRSWKSCNKIFILLPRTRATPFLYLPSKRSFQELQFSKE